MDLINITHIAFDADDTLWGHEDVFVDAKERCLEILGKYLPEGKQLEEELYRFERKNLQLFGYGVKGFLLSMIETAVELSAGKVSGTEIQRIIDLGKEMLVHPINLLPYVREAIDYLEDHFSLLVITKGDLFDQENKIARSGIGHHFPIVEIVSEKNPKTYRNLLKRHQIPAENFLMIGNSLKSDILPVLKVGGRAIHLPYTHTWMHEKATPQANDSGYWAPSSLEEAVTAILGAIAGAK
ncbi:MAG: HAD family hydrolase [Bacteroidota bacterium]